GDLLRRTEAAPPALHHPAHPHHRRRAAAGAGQAELALLAAAVAASGGQRARQPDRREPAPRPAPPAGRGDPRRHPARSGPALPRGPSWRRAIVATNSADDTTWPSTRHSPFIFHTRPL